jgi:putative membrane protein
MFDSMILLIKLLVSAVAIFITAQILPGVNVSDLKTALLVAVVLGIINMFVKPIVVILTLPINVITLGLFTFVINGIFIPGRGLRYQALPKVYASFCRE